jgi:hypothetical protein
VHHLARNGTTQHRVVDLLHLAHAAFAEDHDVRVTISASGRRERVEGVVHARNLSTRRTLSLLRAG